jgi:iron complex outermembrane receptor protein
MRMMMRHTAPLVLALFGSAAIVSPGQAQERPAASGAGVLGEIIVTARKRQESILKVPVVETVLSEQALDRAQVDDFYTLSAHVPGLVVGNQGGVIGPGVTLRGVGVTAVNPTVDQSVSINVDGLQLSQGYAFNAATFDIGQVEVLRGPQSLFYGKNSPAGVISLRTADPTSTPEVVLRAGYEGVAQEKLVEAILSGPVSDTVKLRFAGHYSDNNGYFRNRDTAPVGFGVRTPTTKRYGAETNWVLRGTALFTPSTAYDARLKVNYTHDMLNFGGGNTQLANCPGGLVSFTGLPVFDPNEDCRLNRDFYVSWPDRTGFPLVRHDGVPYVRNESEFGTLEQNVHFDRLTLTSLTGFYSFHQAAMQSGSDTGGLTPFYADNDFKNRQLTQELRLTSDFKGPLNFMVGGFYQDGRMVNHPRIYGNAAIGFPVVLQQVVHDIDIKSVSAFGQLIWNVTDKVELSGGARITHEKRTHTQFNLGTLGVPVGFTTILDPRISSTNTSPDVALTYRPTDDLTLFTSYREGFKSGSFNSVVFYDPTTPTSFGDESVKNIEIGLKARLLDRRMNLNLAVYHARYSGLQVGSIEVTTSGVIALNTLNAASAKSDGVDFDVSYSPAEVEGLTLRAAINYNRARYGRFDNAPCGGNQTIAQGCNQLFSATDNSFHAQDLTGRPLARAPKWSANSGFDYEAPVGREMRVAVAADVAYTSRYYTNIISLPGFVQKGFAKANASVALKGPDDGWELALIANNITDKITSGFCANSNANGALAFGGQITGQATGGPAGSDYAACSPARGREIWVRVTVRPMSLTGR